MFILVSSSLDLAESRKKIARELGDWLERQGVSGQLAPYLWEEQTDRGRLLADRMPIQPQLADAFDTFSQVPFVVCLFGERCGVPLADELPNADWARRIGPWRAGTDGRGLVHPWPTNAAEQDRVLGAGGFPLTGTVFELISACEADASLDNLVVGYVANSAVTRATRSEDIFFNQGKWRTLIAGQARNPAEERTLLDEHVVPQVRALINLINFFGERCSPMRLYTSEAELVADLLERTRTKLGRRLRLASDRNPFKTTLEHWSVDDELRLPGRDDKVRQVLTAVDKGRTGDGRLILLTGTSGSGKSSLLNRGVLAALSERGWRVVPLRPTDVAGAGADEDHVDVLWARICEAIQGPPLHPPSKHKRDEWMAKTLVDALETQGVNLAIGLDQFEEVLDDLALFKAGRHRTTRWWLVLRFLKRLADCRRVQLIATLESTRWATFETLGIEQELDLRRLTVDVDPSADDAARIAQVGFASAGINLDDDVLEEIKTQWNKLQEQQVRHGYAASPLPLACLRFATLFERIEHLAPIDFASPQSEAASTFSQASKGIRVSLEQVGGAGALVLDGLIDKLADAAWLEAGMDPIDGWPVDSAPHLCNTLSNLLDPLVGVDAEGHLRLFAVTPRGADASSDRLRATFRRARLLVPAGRQPDSGDGDDRGSLLRLVHQAVVDRWKPARLWFEWRRHYLVTEARMRSSAKAWADRGRRPAKASAAAVRDAASVLLRNRINWLFGAANPGERDGELRDYCEMLFRQATDPRQVVAGSLFESSCAYLACAYHMVDLLERFWAADPSFVTLRQADQRDLFQSAAWQDGPAVPWLIGKKVTPAPDSAGWHPITAAIQVGANANYQYLIAGLPSLKAPIGPQGATALGVAARYGNLAVVRDLLDKGCDPDSPDERRWTALIAAAAHDHVDAFKLLLPFSNIEATTCPPEEFAALHVACFYGSVRIVQALLDDLRVDESARERALVQKNGWGDTPLAVAASRGRVECLKLLLSVCDPRDPVHRSADGKTLFHHAVARTTPLPTEEERVRARRSVEVLLGDGRLDPALLTHAGKAAFELATAFPEARRALRQSMPIRYADMTVDMRRSDLLSAYAADALRLIREAPNALTDLHGGESGFEILLNEKKIKVLSVVLQERLVAADVVRAWLPRLAGLAAERAAGELRRALADTLRTFPGPLPALPVLLDRALRDRDDALHDTLVELGTRSVAGGDSVAASIFHDMAMTGDRDAFARVAAKHRLALPIDAFGRRPSDVAALDETAHFKALEVTLFDPPLPVRPQPAHTTRLHDYARAGDVTRFEQQARRARIALPLDSEGRRPSDVAPAESRERIAAIEHACFTAQTPPREPERSMPRDPSAPLLVIEQDLRTDVAGSAAQQLLRQVRSLDRLELPPAKGTTIHRRTLPFYDDVTLLELRNPRWGTPGTRVVLLDHDGALNWLDGTSAPIHAINARTNLRITADNVLHYLSFFCFFTRGDGGPFLIVDRLENTLLPRDVDRTSLARCFRPPKILGQDASGDFPVSALVYYDDCVFHADFLVHLDGEVDMLDDGTVATKLGSRIDAPLSPQRPRAADR